MDTSAHVHVLSKSQLYTAISFYYSECHTIKGTTSALFGVATHHRLVIGRDTRNKGVMLITVE